MKRIVQRFPHVHIGKPREISIALFVRNMIHHLGTLMFNQVALSGTGVKGNILAIVFGELIKRSNRIHSREFIEIKDLPVKVIDPLGGKLKKRNGSVVKRLPGHRTFQVFFVNSVKVYGIVQFLFQLPRQLADPYPRGEHVVDEGQALLDRGLLVEK